MKTRANAPKALLRPALFFLICACLGVFAQRPLESLWAAWQTPEYSHGFLIPLLSILIAIHRVLEQKPPSGGSWIGAILFLSGALGILISDLGAFEPLAHASLVLALVGLFMAFWGVRVVRCSWFAFVYLLFAIPVPRLIYVGLSQDLQLLSSWLGVLPFDLIGVTYFRQGNVIDLGTYQLQVAEACSGLRYLFPLMGFSFLVAYLFETAFWKRAVLFLSAIPLTILANALRLTLIGFTVDRWGIEMAEGLLHDFEGWTLFAFCLLALLVEIHFLQKIGTRGRLNLEPLSLPPLSFFSSPFPPLTRSAWLCGFIGLIMFLFALYGGLANRPTIIPPHPPFVSFPLSFGAWTGTPQTIAPDQLDALKASDYFQATYTAPSLFPKSAVNLFIVYYDNQRTGVSVHSPENCLPGSGWIMTDKRTVPLSQTAGARIMVSRAVIERGDEKYAVYYWFDERGRVIQSQYGAKFYLFVDSLLLNRSDGALVRLFTKLEKGETAEAADTRVSTFLQLATPALKYYIPGNIASELSLGAPLAPTPGDGLKEDLYDKY